MMLEAIAIHPAWCCRRHCTAYAPAGAVDRRYHRSEPLVLPTDDPLVRWYVHLAADPDGSEPYIELAELEAPVPDPWWHPRDCLNAVLLPLDAAKLLSDAVGSWCAVAR
jgi:hypothetical protein